MVDLRKYKKKKYKQENKYLEQLKKHRRTMFTRISAIIVLVVLIAAAIITYQKNKNYTQIVISQEFPKTASLSANTKGLNGNILHYSKDGAICVDQKGNKIWNQTFEMQNPLIEVCDDKVVLADYNGHVLYIMDSNGVRGEVNTGMPIRDISISSIGVVAVVLNDSTNTWIKLFDTSGNELVKMSTTMKKNGYPIDISLSKNAMLLGVSFLYADSGEIRNRVAFYNFGDVGQNQIDQLVSGFDYIDSIIPQVKFMDQDTCYALGDNRLVFYKGSQIPSHEAEILLSEEIQGVYDNKDYVALVAMNATNTDKYKLSLYNASGKLVTEVTFDMNYSDIILNEDNILIYNDKECKMISFAGVVKYEGEIGRAHV